MTTRCRRVLTAGTVAALAATVLLFGGALRGESRPTASPIAADVAVSELTSGFAVGDTVRLVESLESQVRRAPGDARTVAALGLAYQQRARETADAAYLTRSEVALRRALALAPGDATATEGLASLALSRHRFRDALVLARHARALSPGSTRPLALVGDALVELGRYDAAFAVFDELAARKPGLVAYSRVAYARELLGHRAAAAEAMRLAVGAAEGRAEPSAWAHVELGKLYFGQGQLTAARNEYRAALASFPGYVFALDGLAHVEAARGHVGRAIELAQRATATVPLPQLVTTLGDLQAVAGQRTEAREQYRLIGAIRKLLGTNGVRTDLELALFDTDHGIELPRALEQAQRAHEERPSIQADDVLAWALVRNGRCAQALRFSRRSLRLGTREALLDFHRGMAERCLGHGAEARLWFQRALRLNQHFSVLWSPVARRYAR
jgi:tetratricopeptide (TPR) repeat protein